MQAIVFFDDRCNLCNGAVGFLRRRDHSGRFRFIPLGSDDARRLIGDSTAASDTFLLLEDGRLYDRSTAALRTLRRLGGFWSLTYPFIIVPRPLRDAVYMFFARRRRRWFGAVDDRCEL